MKHINCGWWLFDGKLQAKQWDSEDCRISATVQVPCCGFEAPHLVRFGMTELVFPTLADAQRFVTEGNCSSYHPSIVPSHFTLPTNEFIVENGEIVPGEDSSNCLLFTFTDHGSLNRSPAYISPEIVGSGSLLAHNVLGFYVTAAAVMERGSKLVITYMNEIVTYTWNGTDLTKEVKQS